MTGTATKMTVMINIVVTVPGLPAVANTKSVPGLHPGRGNLMIEGLQGTMITGEEAMMTADHLIIMMIVAGMTMTENATTEDAMKKKIVTTTGPQDPRMGMHGVEEFITGVWIRETYLCDCFRILDFSELCGVTVVYRARVFLYWLVNPFRRSRIGAIACSGSGLDSATPMVQWLLH